MIDDRDDPLLDACLEEILSGQSPPDLTQRIVKAWSASTGQTHADGNGSPIPPPIQKENVPAEAPKPVVHLTKASSNQRDTRQSWISAAVVAGVLLVGFTLGLFALRLTLPQADEGGNDLAGTDSNQPTVPAPNPIKTPPTPTKKLPKRPSRPAVPHVVDAGSSPDAPLPFVQDSSSQEKEKPSQPTPPRPKPLALADAQVVALIDQQLGESQSQQAVVLAGRATDAEWCRRIYVRVLGRIPTVEELSQFIDSKHPRKRSQLAETLLAGNDYDRNWATIWTNVLIGRTGGTRRGDLANRNGLQQYLRDALHENKPYNRLAHELIAATGSNSPGTKGFNGAVNFLLAGFDKKTTLATDRTSRIFLGQQVQCTQCHNHPFNEWKQQKYWEMNAFFRQMHVARDRQSGSVRLVNRSFLGERGDPNEADVFYEELNQELRVAFPVLPSGNKISTSGYLDEVDRRGELAHWVSQSEELSRAAVNRIWEHFFGYGFTQPVDDMGPHNPVSHPELLRQLAGQFEAHDYDLKQLIRWIVLSEAFGRSSKIPAGELVDAPGKGTTPLFSRYYTRQMQPEEVYRSLLVAANDRDSADQPQEQLASASWMGQFTRSMQTDDGAEENLFDGTVNQSLAIMNGPLMQRAISQREGGLLDQVTQSKATPGEKIDQLFLASVSRRPTPRERRELGKMYASRRDDTAGALQDVWWALLNSNEFILDH